MGNNEAIQHSLEWYRARLGKFTGSVIADLMGTPRAKGETFTQTAKTRIYKVIAEREIDPAIVDSDDRFGEYVESAQIHSRAIERGLQQEWLARDLYQRVTGRAVKERGSVQHPDMPTFASSPDGWVPGTETEPAGVIEIKCPNIDTFTRYKYEIRDNATLKAVAPDYYWQCQSHMAVTGAEWCDFVAFCETQEMPLHITRIEPDADAMQTICNRVALAEEWIAEVTA